MFEQLRAITDRRRSTDDSGFTLVEMLTAMIIFSIFISVLISSLIGISRAAGRVQLLAQSSNSTLSAFQLMDRQIRYANAINFPGAGTSGARYVEFRTGADSSSTGLATCTQWRYVPSTGNVQFRQWQDTATPAYSAWATRVTKVVDLGGTTYPFELVPASSSASAMQQLIMRISSGTDLINPGAAISTRFVARNSSIQSPSNTSAVTAGVSDTPVCLVAGSRP